MTFSIDIDTDDAAFSDDPEVESARILRDIATRVEVGYDGGTVHDLNGNSIGTWALNT